MTQLQLSRSSAAPENFDHDDDLASEYFRWRPTERTRAAIASALDEASRLPVHVARTTSPPSVPSRVHPVIEKFVTSAIILHLDDANFLGELGRLLLAKSLPVLGEASNADLGAPKVGVLLGAVEDLTEWTGMTKQALSKYLGVSYSTVLSWRREQPSRPRHRRIPTLLALWSAVSGTREQFGAEEAARMVWAAGRTDAGAPAIPADELANWLVVQTSESNLADFLQDDGYVPGSAQLPDIEALAEAEARLHATLDVPTVESDDTAGR
jgi:hypothetical protein